jgi:hypothetical protein
MAITWKDDSFKKISQMNIGGQDYYIKDAAAREEIEKISSYTKFLGVTTTELEDGVTTSANITINGETVEAKTGDIAIYGSKEFIFNGTAWNEFGDLDAITDVLGDLAYNDTASADYTPSGSIVVDGSFVGSEATINVSGSTTGEVVVVSDSATGKQVIGANSNSISIGFFSYGEPTTYPSIPTGSTTWTNAEAGLYADIASATATTKVKNQIKYS